MAEYSPNGADETNASETRELGSRPYSEVQTKRVEWVIPGLVPAGMLTVLAGDPKLGKTNLLVAWAARLSREGKPCAILTAEDSPEYTLKARLTAAGADENLVRDVYEYPAFSEDPAWFDLVETMIARQRLRLLMVDPLSAFLGGEADSHKDQDARTVLSPMREIAERTGCGMLYVMHLNKSVTTNVLHRMAASAAFGQVARSVVLMTAETKREEPGRFVAHIACNVAPLAPVELWEEERIWMPQYEGGPIGTVRLTYRRQRDDVDRETLLVVPSPEERGALGEAKEFLMACLASGPETKKNLGKWAAEQDISPRTLRRAREELGVITRNQGPATEWELPLNLDQGGLVPSTHGQGSNGMVEPKPGNLDHDQPLKGNDGQGSFDWGTARLDDPRWKEAE